MYLSRELTDATLPAIGRAFGNRNHTTVMHACKRTAERMAADRQAYDAVHKLTRDARWRVMRSGPPDRLRQFIAQAVAALQRGSPRLVHTMNTTDDH